MATFTYNQQSLPARKYPKVELLIRHDGPMDKAVVVDGNGQRFEVSNLLIRQISSTMDSGGMISVGLDAIVTSVPSEPPKQKEMVLLDLLIANLDPEWVADLFVNVGIAGGTVERDPLLGTFTIKGAQACAAVQQMLTDKYGPSWHERNRAEAKRKSKIRRVRPAK